MERIEAIDALKGYAIILVIVGHVIVYTDPAGYSKNILFMLIYTFHMPLLLFLSGYIAHQKQIGSKLSFLLKKFKGLVFPYIVWNSIGLVIAYQFVISRQLIKDLLNSLIVYYNIWFLPVLFISFIILLLYVYLEDILKQFRLGQYSVVLFGLTYIAIAWFVITPSVQGLYAVRWFAPFVLAGYFAAKYKDVLMGNKKLSILSSLLLFPLLLPFWDLGVIQFASVGYMTLLVCFTLAMLGTAISYAIINLLKGTVINKCFVFCGVFSLEIYLISNLLALLSIQIFHIPLWFGTGMVAVLSGSVTFLLISAVLVLLLSYNKYISIMLFGRWSFKNMKSLDLTFFGLAISLLAYLLLLSYIWKVPW